MVMMVVAMVMVRLMMVVSVIMVFSMVMMFVTVLLPTKAIYLPSSVFENENVLGMTFNRDMQL